jgi:hypothetical protein
VPIQIEIDGRVYTGHYVVAGGMITVSSDLGSRSRPVGRTPSHIMARWMLGELARAAA